MKIPPSAKKALLQLYRELNMSRMRVAWLGAVGRGGTWLTKHGLAINKGKTVYAGNCARMGERPDAWVEFAITEAGKQAALSILTETSKEVLP